MYCHACVDFIYMPWFYTSFNTIQQHKWRKKAVFFAGLAFASLPFLTVRRLRLTSISLESRYGSALLSAWPYPLLWKSLIFPISSPIFTEDDNERSHSCPLLGTLTLDKERFRVNEYNNLASKCAFPSFCLSVSSWCCPTPILKLLMKIHDSENAFKQSTWVMLNRN